MTTVGYGDVVPTQTSGKALAAILMLGGLSFLSIITATITSAFVARRQEELREAGEGPRDAEAGTQISARLDRIEGELGGTPPDPQEPDMSRARAEPGAASRASRLALLGGLAVKHAPPMREHAVHGRRADDRLVGQRQALRVEDERARLRPAEAAVEGDQLLEGAALVELGVVEAADHDVGDVREAVGAQQVARRGR